MTTYLTGWLKNKILKMGFLLSQTKKRN